MANPSPSVNTRFRKGTSGNPRGSSDRARAAGYVNKVRGPELREIIDEMLQGSLAELDAVKVDPASSVLQIWLANLISHGIEKNDAAIFKNIFDRLVGKVREEGHLVESSFPPRPSTIRIQSMSYEEKIAELDRLQKARLELGDD